VPNAVSPRILTLDVLRGFALFGILILNIQAFAIPMEKLELIEAKYVDVGILGTLLGLLSLTLEMKMMGLFSLLFGVSAILISESAERRHRHPGRIYFRRIAILFLVGCVHSAIWWGDILFVYALCAVPLYFLRRLPALPLLLLGVFGYAGFAPLCGLVSAPSGMPYSKEDMFGRAFGMMLIGMASYRWGVVTGARSRRFYLGAMGIGLLIGGLGLEPPQGSVLHRLGMIAMVFGLLGAVVLVTKAKSLATICRWLSAVGRMAFSNYLMHTAVGFAFLSGTLMPDAQMIIVIGIVFLQLALSTLWLSKFANGPAEWLWRWGTYWEMPPWLKAND